MLIRIDAETYINTHHVISVRRGLAPHSVDTTDTFTVLACVDGTDYFTRLPIVDTIGRLRIGADLYPI